MTDPVALTLNLVWFWVCTIYFVNEPEYATQWLSVSVICQLAIGIYLYFAMFGLLPASESVNSFLADYRNRQVLWFSGGGIPRMGGTFNESPLFGLFMLSGFAVLSLELRRRQPGSRGVGLIWTGVIAAAIGTICSFSDQVLIAASILVGALGWNRLRRSGWVRHLVLVSMLTLVGFNISRIYFKNTVEATNGIYVYGESFGQRKYNPQYGLKILAEQPLAVFWGVGPGRFGDYAAEDGMYREESTIQPGVTVIEWLVGYGLIGLVAIAGWLYAIGKQAWIGFGGLGLTVLFALLLGNMFQLRWLWESWFMALAYLYASGARPLFRLTADRARMKCL